MFDRRLIKNFDWGLLGLTCLLACIGLLTLYSAVTAGLASPQKALYYKQLIRLCAGLLVLIGCFVFNYRLLERWAPFIFVVCIGLLVAVLLFGKSAGGAQRWLRLGPVALQPSELVKLGVVFMLARYYARHTDTHGLSFKGLIYPFLVVALPFALIVKQPDLGTAILVMTIAGTVTLFVKIERRTMASLVFLLTAAVPLIWYWLKPYQKQRILTFLDPDRDPLGAGYHIIQSKIAIGSGMLTGKGYLQGTQNSLEFLPEQHTDFIFSVLAEEWGFYGSAGVLCLFLLLVIWGLNVAYRCRDPFGIILALGMTTLIFWQVVINIGMVMGLMPVVGVPLPLISYGGSSILTVLICIGVLLNISMRRFMHE